MYLPIPDVRVDQRLLGLMWLLAESWGQVTPSGTTLPLALTHDALGRLIGARRPTVTLALGELTDRGAIVRQVRGWLLLERLPAASGPRPRLEEPEPLNETVSDWGTAPRPVEHTDGGELSDAERDELRQTFIRLRAEYARNRRLTQARLTALADARERTRQIRWKITQQTSDRPRAPS